MRKTHGSQGSTVKGMGFKEITAKQLLKCWLVKSFPEPVTATRVSLGCRKTRPDAVDPGPVKA